MVKTLNWTKGDLEVRTTTSVNGEPYVEVVKWQVDESGRRYCFVLAYFHKNIEGNVSLNFVGDRPFREIAEIDINEVWKELWLSCLFLEGKDESQY